MSANVKLDWDYQRPPQGACVYEVLSFEDEAYTEPGSDSLGNRALVYRFAQHGNAVAFLGDSQERWRAVEKLAIALGCVLKPDSGSRRARFDADEEYSDDLFDELADMEAGFPDLTSIDISGWPAPPKADPLVPIKRLWKRLQAACAAAGAAWRAGGE